MSATDSISNSDKINYLNIGLMLLSVIIAFYVPFELFLFSYAILGPAHYLTEISWLHERKYFTNGKKDYIILGIAGVLLFLAIYIDKIFPNLHFFDPKSHFQSQLTTGLVYVAFISALAMVVLKSSFHRLIAFIIICVSAVAAHKGVIFFSVFLPTLIHVYLFTGFFMLYGALKGKSKSGYLSCIIFFLIPFLFVFISPDIHFISDYAHKIYPSFHVVNFYSLNVWDSNNYVYPPNFPVDYDNVLAATYNSTAGMMIMRFIAFAYTYHYLNWFSKTSVIKWHQVPKKRLLIIGLLWAISIGFYLYNYMWGFNVLFLLSFLHVFLEFPLNHVTFIGIFKELGKRMGGKPTPVPVKGNYKGKKK
ncbi:hypothetical protein BH09BAC5_BH09BAC5_02100 [soil metagenome]